MNRFQTNFLLRLAVAIILLMHSIPGIFNNGINDFGRIHEENVAGLEGAAFDQPIG